MLELGVSQLGKLPKCFWFAWRPDLCQFVAANQSNNVPSSRLDQSNTRVTVKSKKRRYPKNKTSLIWPANNKVQFVFCVARSVEDTSTKATARPVTLRKICLSPLRQPAPARQARNSDIVRCSARVRGTAAAAAATQSQCARESPSRSLASRRRRRCLCERLTHNLSDTLPLRKLLANSQEFPHWLRRKREGERASRRKRPSSRQTRSH